VFVACIFGVFVYAYVLLSGLWAQASCLMKHDTIRYDTIGEFKWMMITQTNQTFQLLLDARV